MFKTLIYDGIEYPQFLISESGEILNTTTDAYLKPYLHPTGYYYISLPMGKRGLVKTLRLHKALAETFIPNPHNYPLVHHKDEDKSNYNLSNLEWTTVKDNVNKHLEYVSRTNPLCNNRKLTSDDVRYIRNHKGVISQRNLATMFQCSKTTIRNVQQGVCYQHV